VPTADPDLAFRSGSVTYCADPDCFFVFEEQTW
jgi:hypothetical protein